MTRSLGRRAAVATAVLVAGVTLSCTHAAADAGGRPNIVVIQTDDQNASLVTRGVMPWTVKLLGGPGTKFTDYVDSGPLCCPSRAVLLTGQYGHNNGVLWNTPNPYGDLKGKANTLPVWLQQAGYRTVHVGKYLNLYARAVRDPNEVPPGWDEWHTMLEPERYYGYTLRENGRAVRYGTDPGDYLTHVLDDKAVEMIHRYAPGRKPLFIALDQFAPHTSNETVEKGCRYAAIPAPGDSQGFEDARLPKPPSFDEADVSDKPSFIRARERLTPSTRVVLTRQHRCQLQALQAVDRGIRHIVMALRAEHELANTAILFTSDNGLVQGEHRVTGQKVVPYEEALHTPLVIRLPKDMRGSHGQPAKLASTVANIDLAPTIERLARARPCSPTGACRTLDGRSLLGAIRTDGRKWPRHRGILLELANSGRAAAFTPCDYQGIRTSSQMYVEYHSSTGAERGPCTPRQEVEHYDLRSDPFELDNLFPAAAPDERARERSLASRLSRLEDCAGIDGRDPRPPSGHHCE